MWLGMWMMSCPEAMGWDSWVFWKKQLVEIWTYTGRVGIRIWVRPVQLFAAGCARVFWVSELRADAGQTVSIVKIVSLSPRVENLKVKKVIKFSYLNQGSRQCFECFSNSYALCIFHIFVYYGHVTYYRCYNQTGKISTLEGTSLKLVYKFTYLSSSVSSTEKDTDAWLTKAWTAINRLSIIWRSDLTNKMKRSFFQAAVVSILLYVCTNWTQTKRLEKKLDGNYTRMLRAILNKSWRQHPTKHQIYGHLPPIPKTIQARRTRHVGNWWGSRNELISDVLLWGPHIWPGKSRTTSSNIHTAAKWRYGM